ncbi:short-chain fatty acyl-CoA regulator family protein [Nocardia sp. NBC_00508]|uniref:short-chain fatty acyl-CoA regulator family protein n=1 Tax=Nocardia sp. NBC_00508 TaxID=2975992 RepID=UPI002E7FBB84|nr:short-chain fatty acyl-CoA regulator family protein [Nocardia sp. NBC_00508]WUD64921.1 short-chain fatty acyl-CoA regulator family protein [Nocardia sp. NBC_00508]
MRKMYAGARLRRLREERRMTQAALAKSLDLSPSYLNQLERDQRPLTIPVLLKLNSTFDLDVQFFAADSDARLVSDLHEVLVDAAGGHTAPLTEVEELATRQPEVARIVVAMHRRLRATTDQLDLLSARVSAPAGAPGVPMPYEDVRDFFYDHHNHIPQLDIAAEQLFENSGLSIGSLDRQLARIAEERARVTVLVRGDGADPTIPKRHYDPENRTLTLARRLRPGQRAFQIATTLAFLLYGAELDAVLAETPALSGESRTLARIGLANYFAGALVLPYGRFLRSAEELHYDIDLLSLRFEVGFETICHRLSTLQRQGQRGVPFFFVRTDRAGNISKRQSATAFHFSRVGGSCPLWVVHEAFAHPGRILTQVAEMPDGRRYLWIARTAAIAPHGFGTAAKNFAIGLGCDIEYAERLVYSAGLQLDDPAAAVPIGAGCKVCERPACAQRAFPHIGSPLAITEHTSSDLPYPRLGR